MTSFRNVVEQVAKALPEIKKPGRKVSLTEKLGWTALALVIYLWMGNTLLYGLPAGAQAQQTPFLFNIIFAAKQGTLITLGIGPIVTAGLILQLLVGAEIIKLDLTKPNDRAVFTTASKLLAIIVTIFEGAAFTLSGFFGPITQEQAYVIFAQLVAATVIIIMLDEMVQKGWGLGSGISLFIAAGVAEQVFVNLFSPIILQDGFYQGIIPALVQGIAGAGIAPLFIRIGGFPDIVGLIATIVLIIILIYIESIRIEIPIAYAKFSGYRAKYPIKLLYVSNIPIIFASTVFSNIFYIGSLVWTRFNPENTNTLLNFLGTFVSDPDRGVIPTGGLAYYVTPPLNLQQVFADPLHALIYAALLTTFAVLFAKFWVQIGGLSPYKVANQLIAAGMQVPGFRRSPAVIARVLQKYISTVTIIGGLIIGIVGSVSDYFGVFGSGIGLLLMTSILHQYYQILLRERITEMHPAIGRLLGEE